MAPKKKKGVQAGQESGANRFSALQTQDIISPAQNPQGQHTVDSLDNVENEKN